MLSPTVQTKSFSKAEFTLGSKVTTEIALQTFAVTETLDVVPAVMSTSDEPFQLNCSQDALAGESLAISPASTSIL